MFTCLQDNHADGDKGSGEKEDGCEKDGDVSASERVVDAESPQVLSTCFIVCYKAVYTCITWVQAGFSYRQFARVKTLHARVKFKSKEKNIVLCIYMRGNAPDKSKAMFARGHVETM